MTVGLNSFLMLGFNHINVDLDRRKQFTLNDGSTAIYNENKKEKWSSIFGTNPNAAYNVWKSIRKQAAKQKITLQHFFWTMRFLKSKDPKRTIANTIHVDRNIFAGWVQKVLLLIQANHHKWVSRMLKNYSYSSITY